MSREAAVVAPESTAARVALWRALHVAVDPPPHVLEDEVGLRLLAPAAGWQQRPDMDPARTRPFRASIVARARFVDDLVVEQATRGVAQYVLLGAGLDTFAQRRPDVASRLRVFEVDQPGPQAWKRGRLVEAGYGIPDWLRFVPVDFETAGDWWRQLVAAGFDPATPAVVASLGVSMYLTRDAIVAMFRQAAECARGSTFVTTFLWPVDQAEPEIRPALEFAVAGARASGTPFLSFFLPPEIMAIASETGFHEVEHVPLARLQQRYFAGRGDGLRLPNRCEDLLVATR